MKNSSVGVGDAPTSDGAESVSSQAPRVVITGFEPFDGRTRNRSWDLVRRIELKDGYARHRLPVDFIRLREMVLGILAQRPRVLLMVGESATSEVLVEQIALNVADTDDPDNAGRMPQNQTLVDRAPLALSAPWDARVLAGLMHQEGIPAVVSFHAGTFACNAAFYFALNGVREQGASEGSRTRDPIAVGFLHVPNSRGTAGLRSRNLAQAVELAVDELLRGTPAGNSPPVATRI